MKSLTRKLRWRIHLLLDPHGFVEREPLFAGRGEFPIRDTMLNEMRNLSLGERLEFVQAFRFHGLDDLLLRRRLRRTPDGEEYFDLSGRKIFFRPEHVVIDESEMLEGVLLILKEAYVLPTDFFSPEVQISPGDIVLDVGGNIGTSALLFSPLVGPSGKVFSFEPVFHSVLRRNVEENGIDNVRVVPQGVSNVPGVVEFAVTDRGIDSRMACPTFGGGGPTVEMDLTTLDRFVDQEGLDRIDFVKMDIEGAEELALRGAARVIERFRPRWSIASYHTDPEGDQQHPKLVRLLKGMGYNVREKEDRHIYAW